MRNKKLIVYIFCLTLLLLGLCNLTSCTRARPDNTKNICNIFEHYHDWYWDASDVRKKWGLPISVLMSIIYQESNFNAKAKPPRTKLLWIIPWKRPTTAYGYSQAVNDTWKTYQRESGGSGAGRTAFEDAADFIGWYTHRAHVRADIPMTNAYGLYLAYHEGIGNYQKGSYKKKQWLMNVAWKVQRRANTYRAQLQKCEASLPKKPWWHVW